MEIVEHVLDYLFGEIIQRMRSTGVARPRPFCLSKICHMRGFVDVVRYSLIIH